MKLPRLNANEIDEKLLPENTCMHDIILFAATVIFLFFSFSFFAHTHTCTLNDRISLYFYFLIWSNRRIPLILVLFLDYTQMSICKRFNSNRSRMSCELLCVCIHLVFSLFFFATIFIQYFMIMSLFFSVENFSMPSVMTRSRRRINNGVYIYVAVCACVFICALYASVYMFFIVAIMI